MSDFNQTHPERRKGEVFVGNGDDATYKLCGWFSKRKGETAYDLHGRPMTPEMINKMICAVDSQGNTIKTKGFYPIFADAKDILLNSRLVPGIQVLKRMLPEKEHKDFAGIHHLKQKNKIEKNSELKGLV